MALPCGRVSISGSKEGETQQEDFNDEENNGTHTDDRTSFMLRSMHVMHGEYKRAIRRRYAYESARKL